MSMMKIEGTGSGSISQKHGSADPDPHQKVMVPQHWFWQCACRKLAALHCIVRQPMHNLLATGGLSHTNFTWVAARCMLIVPSWPRHIQHEWNQREFACNWPQREYNLHATGGRSGTICMRLEATLIRFVCDWPPDSHHFSTSTPTTLPPPPTPLSDSHPLTCFLCVGNDWIPICLQIRVR